MQGALSRQPPVISNHLSVMLFAIIIKSKEIVTYSVSIFLHYMIGMAGNKIMLENDRRVYKKNIQDRSRYVLDVRVKKVYVKRPYVC